MGNNRYGKPEVFKGNDGIDTVIITCGLYEMNDEKRRQELIEESGYDRKNHRFGFIGTGEVHA